MVDQGVLHAVLVRESVQVLDSIAITGQVTRGVRMGREAFEERRLRGFGKFIDSEELRRSEHRKLPEILLAIPGIRVIRWRDCGANCGGAVEERAANSRGETTISRMGRENTFCWLSVMLDGRWLYVSGSRMGVPDLSRDILISDLDMVEVYRSAGETPGEFSGSGAGCGVILLWSRKAP